MGIDTGLDTAVSRPVATNSTLEREAGIEPASLAWKAKVLPLNYSRLAALRDLATPLAVLETGPKLTSHLVEEAGFEPA
jgi:hypothetical protein